MKNRHSLPILIVFLILLFSAELKAQSAGYLFAYFTGNKIEQEQIHFAISKDGFKYSALNNNKPVIDSKTISSSGGVRDPHILRGEDGKTFYMVVTDMASSKGWESNRAMLLMKSLDLINWTSNVINIQQKYKGHEDLKRVWAPQTIYDAEAGKYMVYWSMKHGNQHDIIYYAYANKDFTDLETEPKPLFIPRLPAFNIDGDIIRKDNIYYLFRKTGGADGAGVKVATSTSLTSGNWEENDRYLQPTKEEVEGSSVFKLNNSRSYIMMYDLFKAHSFQFSRSEDLLNFKVIDNEVEMDFKPRHGSVISLSKKEMKSLQKKWGN